MLSRARGSRMVVFRVSKRQPIVGERCVVSLQGLRALLRVEARRKGAQDAQVLGIVVVLDLALDVEPVRIVRRTQCAGGKETGEARKRRASRRMLSVHVTSATHDRR